jgi:hypothetical protein
VQEQPEPVVVEVSESVSNAFDLLDEQVDGFGGPLDAPPVVCQARISVSHRLIVRANRAVSGNPQLCAQAENSASVTWASWGVGAA